MQLYLINMLILLSIRCIFFDKTSKEQIRDRQGVLLQNENGKLMISKDTIENLVSSVAKGYPDTKDISTRVDLDKDNNLNVFVTLYVTNNALIKDNEILDSLMGDVFDIINNSNILVLKCFKYMFKHFSRSIGGWISLFLILAQIAMVLLYFLMDLGKMKIRILSLTNNYIQYLSKKGKESENYPPKRTRGISNKNKSSNK